MIIHADTTTIPASWTEWLNTAWKIGNFQFTTAQLLIAILALVAVILLILFIIFAVKNGKKKNALKKAKAKSAAKAAAPAAPVAPAPAPAAAPAPVAPAPVAAAPAAPAPTLTAVTPDDSYYIEGSQYIKKDEKYFTDKLNAHVACLEGAAKDPEGYFVVDKFKFGAILHKDGIVYVQVYLYDKGENHILSAPITVRVSDDAALEKAVFLLNVAHRDAKAL